MAEDVSASTTAAAPSPAPPVVTGTPSGAPPDLGGLVQPGAQPNMTTAIQGSMAPFQANEQAAIQKASDLANAPTTPTKPVPHARLLSMVQGLALGLDSFGKAIATHGREGGAEEVQQVQAQQQQQKIQAQQAQEARKNTQIQQQLMVADTNHKLAQNVLFMATLPDEITASHLKVAGEAQGQAITGADFQASHGGMKPEEFSSALSGTGPAASANSFFNTNAQQTLAAAKTAGLSDTDPYVQKLQSALADPKTSAGDLYRATTQLQSQQTRQGAALKEKAEKNAADPLFKYQQDPAELAKPGAQAALQAYIADPQNKTNLDGVARAKLLMAKADIAQKNEITQAGLKASATKNAEMAATAGDPKQAGQLLAEGSLTLADLKSRGSSPAQIIAATNAAKDYAKSQGRTYNASDEVTGEQALKGATNQTFYGSARSLVQQGGMLDQLKAAHDALGNQKIPALNSIADWMNFQAGTPELANYKQAVLAAADDYAKVMGGGSPNLEQFNSIRDGFANKLGNTAFDGAVGIARNSVRSQVTGRIGQNQYIMQREGDILHDDVRASNFARPTGVSPDAKLMQVPGHDPVWIGPESLAAAQKANPTMVEVK